MKNWWVSGEYTAADIGEIIKEIREDYLKLSQEHLADNIGVKLVTLQSSDNGKGAHGDNVLRRTCKKYNLESSITIKTK